MHDVEPTAENCPPLQITHAIETDVAEYVLLEQRAQLLDEAAE